MRLARLTSTLTVLAALGACSAPERLAGFRSPLLDPPTSPLTPEARPSPIPVTPLSGAPGADGSPDFGEAVARTAREYLGRKQIVADGRQFPSDCTGFVRAVFARHGIDLLAAGAEPGDNGVTAIYRFTSRNGRILEQPPRPGDIVFFRETYDRNRDGRANDGLTHVGIVERVEDDGTVLVLHRVARGVVRYRMNVARPSERKDPKTGRVLNDYLKEGNHKQRLAGELFAGFGRVAR
jgi:hypothetical protein